MTGTNELDDRDRAVLLYKAGLSASAVGESLGVSGQTVLNWLRGRGEDVRDRGRAVDVTPAERQVAIALYRAGESPKRIAEFYGVGEKTVRSWVRKANAVDVAEILQRPTYDGEVRTKVVLEVAGGCPVAKVVAKFGVPRSTVYRWVTEHAGEPEGQQPN
jgi:transposase